jgi:hypothetical protein
MRALVSLDPEGEGGVVVSPHFIGCEHCTNLLMLSHKVTKSKSQVAIPTIHPICLKIPRHKSKARAKPEANLDDNE